MTVAKTGLKTLIIDSQLGHRASSRCLDQDSSPILKPSRMIGPMLTLDPRDVGFHMSSRSSHSHPILVSHEVARPFTAYLFTLGIGKRRRVSTHIDEAW